MWLLLLAMGSVVLHVGAMIAAAIAPPMVLGSAILGMVARLGRLGRCGCEAGVCRVVDLHKRVCVCRAGIGPVASKAGVPDPCNACKHERKVRHYSAATHICGTDATAITLMAGLTHITKSRKVQAALHGQTQEDLTQGLMEGS